MFKVGDRVRCVKPYNGLERNEVYIIEDGPSNSHTYKVEGVSGYWSENRFLLMPEIEDLTVGLLAEYKSQAGS